MGNATKGKIGAEAMIFLKKNSRSIPIVLGILTFLARFPAQGGEDIGNARKNKLSESPTDFWGGVSSLVYGHFPSIAVVNWETALIAFQVTIASICLSSLMRTAIPQASKKLLWLTLLAYLALMFSSQGTRDGLQFTFLLAGFTIGMNSSLLSKLLVKKAFSLTLLLIGISLRPWLGLALVPPILFMVGLWPTNLSRKNSIKKILGIATLVIIAPIGLELGATKVQNLKPSYPQQQVMIMDSAATYCWGINPSSAERALKALRLFTSNEDLGSKICQFYRADTWLSLTKSSQPSNTNLSTDFWLIKAGDAKKYQELQTLWIQNIVNDPITYIQNKTFFFMKLVVASEMRNLRLFNSNNWHVFLQNLYISIYDLILAAHLLSLLSLWLGLFLYSQIRKRQILPIEPGVSPLVVFSFLWAMISTVAYIGSNGRYTYSATLLVLILISFREKLIKIEQP